MTSFPSLSSLLFSSPSVSLFFLLLLLLFFSLLPPWFPFIYPSFFPFFFPFLLFSLSSSIPSIISYAFPCSFFFFPPDPSIPSASLPFLLLPLLSSFLPFTILSMYFFFFFIPSSIYITRLRKIEGNILFKPLTKQENI